MNTLPSRDGYYGCVNTWIAGTVRDAQTRAVIPSKTAVAIESGYPNSVVETILRPGADGKFSFCAVQKEYVLVAVAADAHGNYYAPAVHFVLSVPAEGIELLVGTPSSSPIGPTYLAGPISTDALNVALRAYPQVSIGTDVFSRIGNVLLPTVATSTGYADLVSTSGSCGAPGCAAYQLIVPSQQPSVYTGSEWRHSPLPLLYSVQVNAYTCLPWQRTALPVPSSGSSYASPGVTLPMVPLTFTNCR